MGAIHDGQSHQILIFLPCNAIVAHKKFFLNVPLREIFVCSTIDFGEEKSLALSNKNSEQVMKALESLVNDGEK